MTAATTLGVGTRVSIEPHPDLLRTAWWPKGPATGVVRKVFKNGKVAVAVDRIRNRGGDGRVTIHFTATRLTPID